MTMKRRTMMMMSLSVTQTTLTFKMKRRKQTTKRRKMSCLPRKLVSKDYDVGGRTQTHK